jgi:uncharacterized membrane protein
MSPSQSTIHELLAQPNVSALIPIENKQKIIEYLIAHHQKKKEPLYIRVLIGAGAWFASFFLLLFVGIAIGFAEELGAIVIGLGFLVATVFIEKNTKALFLEQVSLVLAISGNVLFVGGLASLFDDHEILIGLVMHAMVCCAMYILLNNSFYRFIAPLGLVIIAIAWVIETKTFEFIHFVVLIEMILVGILISLKKTSSFFLPLTYSAYLMLPSTILFLNLIVSENMFRDFKGEVWPSSVIICCGLIWLFIKLAGGNKKINEPWMILLIASTIALGAFSAPGILVAIGLLVLGYTFDERMLTTISYAFLTAFLILFYYVLNTNLLEKSLIIAGSGFLLLLMRWVARRWEPKEPLT